MSDKKIADRLVKIKELTTNLGIYQHGKLDQPDPKFGYALDDQARALLIAHNFQDLRLEKIYLTFLVYATQKEMIYHYFYDGKDRIMADSKYLASEDALGMVGWALKETQNIDGEFAVILERIYGKAKNWIHLRSIAYLLLGLLSEEEEELEGQLVERLLDSYTPKDDWRWFENRLVYGNAIIPWSLWKRARIRGDQKAIQVASETTNFLIEVCRENGVVMPVGNRSWYEVGKGKSLYDQQPIDVSYMICCLEEAYLVTHDSMYLDEAKNWWGWFWGKNTKGVMMVDKNGACYDAVTDGSGGVNLNQGAESNICFLLAFLAARRLGLAE